MCGAEPDWRGLLDASPEACRSPHAACRHAGESHDGAGVVALYDAHALSREGHAHPVTSYKVEPAVRTQPLSVHARLITQALQCLSGLSGARPSPSPERIPGPMSQGAAPCPARVRRSGAPAWCCWMQGSQDMVTMVACMGGVGGQLVLSGARDGTIALYDTRSSAQAATFAAGAMVSLGPVWMAGLQGGGQHPEPPQARSGAAPSPAVSSPCARQHTPPHAPGRPALRGQRCCLLQLPLSGDVERLTLLQMRARACPQVTTLDSQEHYVYAGNLKGDLSRWDLRAARTENSAAFALEQTTCVDGSAVLRCALGARPGWGRRVHTGGPVLPGPLRRVHPRRCAHPRPAHLSRPSPAAFRASLPEVVVQAREARKGVLAFCEA